MLICDIPLENLRSKIMKLIPFIIVFLLAVSCKEKKAPITAQFIIDTAIVNACSGNCETATISFKFRDKHYTSKRNGGKYELERIFIDSTGTTRDVLTNDDFKRYKNDTLIKVPDSMVTRYSNSVNSVHYFVQLPFGLNAPAVKKELLGEATIEGSNYYEIGVTFSEEGGGTDFDDSFVYWIHKENYTVDYLAYQYATNGGGIRFREAYNVRNVEGIRFVDYNNYKPESLGIPLKDLAEMFENGKLKLLSKIESEKVVVKL